MAIAKYRWTDTKGKLYVDCSECERGGNGSDKDKCCCGCQVKRGRQGGCFLGTLRAGLTVSSANIPLCVKTHSGKHNNPKTD